MSAFNPVVGDMKAILTRLLSCFDKHRVGSVSLANGSGEVGDAIVMSEGGGDWSTRDLALRRIRPRRNATAVLNTMVILGMGSEGDTVGEIEGDTVGDIVGDTVGDTVGDMVGDDVGVEVEGERVGDMDGIDEVGDTVGVGVDGDLVGDLVSPFWVGDWVGDVVGTRVGEKVVGVAVGMDVGMAVGLEVGDRVAAMMLSITKRSP